MKRDPRVCLQDANKAAAEIGNFIEGMDFGTFRGDLRTQWAVEHGFAILAEALNRLGQSSPEVAAKIPRLGEFVGFRNQLIHEYQRVDPEKVWDHTIDDLPGLRIVLQSLIDELDRDASIGKTPPDAEAEDDSSSLDPF